MMTENEIATAVVDSAYKIHVGLGPGLLESIYEVTLCHELKKRGGRTVRQLPIPIIHDGLHFDDCEIVSTQRRKDAKEE